MLAMTTSAISFVKILLVVLSTVSQGNFFIKGIQLFSRYTELNDIEAPHNAKFSSTGERFTKLTFLDFK